MRFGTSIFDLASLGQISWCQTALTLPPWVVYSVNTLQSYGLYITYIQKELLTIVTCKVTKVNITFIDVYSFSAKKPGISRTHFTKKKDKVKNIPVIFLK